MSKVDETYTKYAIVTNKTELRLHLGTETTTEVNNDIQDTGLTVEAGTLLKVFQTRTLGSTEYSTVQVLDFVHNNPIYENSLFQCLQTDMRKVNEDLWPYVISISDVGRRLNMVQDKDHCRWIFYLKKNDFVSVPGEVFGRENSVHFDCIIRYIGPVQELRPVGYCFGLELLHLDYGYSPQAEEIPFSTKYIDRDSSLSMFLTADQIVKYYDENKKNFSMLEFITDTVENLRNVTGSMLQRTIQYFGFNQTSAK